MISDESLYVDNLIIIKKIDNRLQCEWVAKNEVNHSYMEAKLTEFVCNKFPGTWPVKDIGEAEISRGMRCFLKEWKGDVLTARWI